MKTVAILLMWSYVQPWDCGIMPSLGVISNEYATMDDCRLGIYREEEKEYRNFQRCNLDPKAEEIRSKYLCAEVSKP